MPKGGPSFTVIQHKRYRRIIAFAAGVLGQTVWWDGVFTQTLCLDGADRGTSRLGREPAHR